LARGGFAIRWMVLGRRTCGHCFTYVGSIVKLPAHNERVTKLIPLIRWEKIKLRAVAYIPLNSLERQGVNLMTVNANSG